MTEDLNDDIIQFLMDQLNKGYSEYKKNHPDFSRIVETDLEGKTDEEFEAQFIKNPSNHCICCGEWLEGFDTCSECERINK